MFLISSASLPARSRWGRNLIRGKYHQTWRRWRAPRPPTWSQAGQIDANSLCARLHQFCRASVGARPAGGGLEHVQKRGWRISSPPSQGSGWRGSAAELTPPSHLLFLQLKYTKSVFVRLNLTPAVGLDLVGLDLRDGPWVKPAPPSLHVKPHDMISTGETLRSGSSVEGTNKQGRM